MFDMRAGGWLPGILLIAAACSSGGQGARDAGATGGSTGADGAPSQASDTDAANPHVTVTPPASPNGPPTTGKANGTGNGGAAGAGGAGNGGAAGAAANAGATGATGSAGTTTGGANGFTGAAGAPGSLGTAGVTGAGGASGVTGAGGGSTVGPPVTSGTAGDSGGAGAMSSGAGGTAAAQRSWPTVDCVGGPCAAPNVCVNLDFLFVACVPCGGNDQVCCPPFDPSDPFLGTCDAGLICAANPNFQSTPPADLVRDVCQVPGAPPPADGGLNHERVKLFP
jgi:hypothetical protein